MANNCRVLQKGKCEVTQTYWNKHQAIDIVGANYTLDNIVSHSDGVVVAYRNNYSTTDSTGNSYGNYVKIKHDNDYYTLYAHMVYKSVKVKTGDKVKKGTVLGAMGNTGHSFGGHLHFEVYRGNNLINPTIYLTEDLPTNNKPNTLKYSVGDKVNVNGIYVSSESTTKLKPAITTGVITKVINNARNPYLLDNGNIGWANDNCIVSSYTKVYKTVSNCSYLNLRTSASYGNNIYTSVKAGTKLEYLGVENGWSKVVYSNKTLYCGSSYLR